MRTLRRLALNRWDLGLGLVAILVATVAFAWFVRAADPSIRSALIAGWIAVALACAGGIIRLTATRQGSIRLFSSEIRALQFGLHSMDMLGFWRALHADPAAGAGGFADVARKESYFAFIHASGATIGNLHPDVVESTVRFYTYLKMSRDAADSLGGWDKVTDPVARRAHIRYVVILLAQSMLWGFIARWHMGAAFRPDDYAFLAEIEKAYDEVTVSGTFHMLCGGHQQRAVLTALREEAARLSSVQLSAVPDKIVRE
ncbi:hypothetical protein LGR54_21110 [Ancylobacter sp. Lp-2]|uniref:hypothetical protein n=1 Tax=Ancylobacter sp. Lp-2 TaxID=2881339 RepID=UPI001E29BD74|nr:hypothetical protein [Ancylobacter sp. Lp-2]MCB4771114.1 hypothetical protein [Ancylobacter sp. Lp-2]